jgi:lipopolysaccharide/colanic/teichoic acid biosynthesis glycosyltransferase
MLEIRDAKNKVLPDNLRLTKVGLFFRSLSLDELPSLWNVIKGDMSLVGPRPLLMEYLPLYNKKQYRRHDVKPGITGWAQVNGRNSLSWQDRFNLDVWYVDNQSFLLDLKILVMTFKKVIFRNGISEDGHVTMSKFTGNTK